jgi:hypothetical protein
VLIQKQTRRSGRLQPEVLADQDTKKPAGEAGEEVMNG